MKIEIIFNEFGTAFLKETNKTVEEVRKLYCGKYFNIGTKEQREIDKVIILKIIDENGEVVRAFDEWGNDMELDCYIKHIWAKKYNEDL